MLSFKTFRMHVCVCVRALEVTGVRCVSGAGRGGDTGKSCVVGARAAAGAVWGAGDWAVVAEGFAAEGPVWGAGGWVAATEDLFAVDRVTCAELGVGRAPACCFFFFCVRVYKREGERGHQCAFVDEGQSKFERSKILGRFCQK